MAVRLPSLRDVLRRMFDRAFLCQTKWQQLHQAIEAHPEFDTYFQPLGRSLDRLSVGHEQWVGFLNSEHFIFFQDERLPSELLQKQEAQQLFADFQRELLDEITLERQAEKFRAMLAHKKAVTPGKTFADAKGRRIF